MWNCKHCSKEFEFSTTSQKANHSRWCPSNPKSSDTKGLREAQLRMQDERAGPKTSFTVACVRCETPFEVIERANLHPQRSAYFCSRSCANHRGEGLKWAEKREHDLTHYRSICFAHHEKKCVVCEERKIVTVHHLDEDHTNNNPENLIPMCPTHHQYWHSRYRSDVEDIVRLYIESWKKKKK